ncbi:hypothetical protein [Citrobacter braakii]|uniref:hypothetical protein n=1 Tax=Citrobacter braakii TaxID=57706 RepID=UPI0023B1FF6F|nr:hypothetical protein [Citrobacter braakii]
MKAVFNVLEMIMKIQGGGPAFPYQLANRSGNTMRTFGVDLPPGKTADFGGMPLRDYFAAKAMQGFIANKDRPTTFHPDDDAGYAYAIADAMLRAREEP